MARGTRPINERMDKPAIKRPLAPAPLSETRQPTVTPAQAFQRVTSKPGFVCPADILQLQHTLGNRAVGALLARPTPLRPLIQAKLTVNAPGDTYEQEADRVAEQIISIPALQRDDLDADEKPAIMTLPGIQRSGDGAFEVDEAFQRQLGASRGNGQPLSAALREQFETKFGVDFSGVRIHADAQSDVLNRSIQAKAFTTGQDVFFRQGAYEPSSRNGQKLLAHELTHVVQQRGYRTQALVERKPNDAQLGIHCLRTAGHSIQRGLPEVDDKASEQIKAKGISDSNIIKRYEWFLENMLEDKNQNSFTDPNDMTLLKAELNQWKLNRSIDELKALVAKVNKALKPEKQGFTQRKEGWDTKIDWLVDWSSNPEWKIIDDSINMAEEIVKEVVQNDAVIAKWFGNDTNDMEEVKATLNKVISHLKWNYAFDKFRKEESDELSSEKMGALQGGPDGMYIKLGKKFFDGNDLVENAINLIHEGSHAISGGRIIKDFAYVYSLAHGLLSPSLAKIDAPSYESAARDVKNKFEPTTPDQKGRETVKQNHPGIAKGLAYADMKITRAWVIVFNARQRIERAVFKPDSLPTSDLSDQDKNYYGTVLKLCHLPAYDTWQQDNKWEPLGIDLESMRKLNGVLSTYRDLMQKVAVEIDDNNQQNDDVVLNTTKTGNQFCINKSLNSATPENIANRLITRWAEKMSAFLAVRDMVDLVMQITELDSEEVRKGLDEMKQ